MKRNMHRAAAILTLMVLVGVLGVSATRASEAEPTLEVSVMQNKVSGYDWPLDAEVTLTIDDPATLATPDFTDSGTVGPGGPGIPSATYIVFNLTGFDIAAGHEVTMTDGVTTKEHTVTALTVLNIDVGADTVSGRAEPGSEVLVFGPFGAQRAVTADAGGDWLADFSVPGPQDFEQDPLDIVLGTMGGAVQFDDDDDGTVVNWEVINPNFTVWLDTNEVWGLSWPLDAEVTLTIDDPATVASPDFTDTQTVVPLPGNPGAGTYVEFLLGDFEVEPGFEATMTDGVTVKVHVVVDIAVTEVDPDADIVYGTADPNTDVAVDVFVGLGAESQGATADDDGNWTLDFSGIVDIEAGTSGRSTQFDEDGDATAVNWEVVPGPTVVWGDNNCSGPPPDPVDALITLRHDAGLSVNTGDCPAFGTEVDVLEASIHFWGDVDCSGTVDPLDALKLLRFDAGLSVQQNPGCPLINSQVQIVEQ